MNGMYRAWTIAKHSLNWTENSFSNVKLNGWVGYILVEEWTSVLQLARQLEHAVIEDVVSYVCLVE